jgi:hypothetical protein
VYPPDELPTKTCPYVGATASPVPPYIVPILVVALTTPPFTCRGPFSPENKLSVPIFALVLDEYPNEASVVDV